MAERTCSEPDCHRPLYARGWCRKHYDRWYRQVGPENRRLPKGSPCIIEGCDKPRQGHGLCPKHYQRWRRNGHPLMTYWAPGERLWQSGTGYFVMTLPADHPLYRAGRAERQHRVLMFDAIGYGPHQCHWCGKHINWGAGLEVDHIDEDKANNDLSNLVQSCHRCNSARSFHLHPERKPPNRWAKCA